MTKWITTLFLLSFGLMASAQYQPFPQSNAIWEGSFIGFVGFPQKQYYVLCGDTTFNGEQYNKLYAVFTDTSGNISNQVFMSGIREDDHKKVWADWGEEPILLYDFNLEPGDTFPAAYYFSPDFIHQTVVDSIGELEVGGEMRRTIFFEESAPFRREFWIEGIGSNYNILDRGLDLPSTADYEPYLECFRTNNELVLNLFPAESVCTFEYEPGPECAISTSNINPAGVPVSIEIYPNPAQHSINLNVAGVLQAPLVLQLYNVYGEVVLQISPIVAKQENIALGYLPSGMYFLQLSDPVQKTQTAIKKLLVQH